MNYQKIKLLGGAEVHVDFDARMTSCKRCKKKIRFGITKNGKSMPIIQVEENWQSHYAADCKFANEFRKTKLEGRIEAEKKNQDFLNNI
ncbi:MAG: hypothetical protein WC788_08195 [Candidatus Paceibacterota bacterium]|jgi:hypothetical protein